MHPSIANSEFVSPLQPKLLDEKQTTIYKRAVEKNYNLKMKASRFIFSEINQKFPIMPFTARFTLLLFVAFKCVSTIAPVLLLR